MQGMTRPRHSRSAAGPNRSVPTGGHAFRRTVTSAPAPRQRRPALPVPSPDPTRNDRMAAKPAERPATTLHGRITAALDAGTHATTQPASSPAAEAEDQPGGDPR
jgi:hypothetical protein